MFVVPSSLCSHRSLCLRRLLVLPLGTTSSPTTGRGPTTTGRCRHPPSAARRWAGLFGHSMVALCGKGGRVRGGEGEEGGGGERESLWSNSPALLPAPGSV